MIQNEWQKVTESRYAAVTDEYGQFEEDPATAREIEMVIKQYSAVNVNNPIYADVTLLALTDNFSVDTNSIITFNDKKYGVKFTIPTRTYLEVFLYAL